MSRAAYIGVVLLTLAALACAALDPDGGVDPTAEATAVSDAGTLDLLQRVRLEGGMGEGGTIGVGEFELNVRGRIQVQALSIVPADEDFERVNAIYIRRARLVFRTKLPFHLSTYLQLAFSRNDMELDEPNVLRDYSVEWRRFKSASVRLGQFKVPFDVQRVISSSALQFPDRSVVTEELNLERDIGLAVFSEDLLGLSERLRYTVAVMGGEGRNRVGTNVGLLYVARVVVSPLGRMDDKYEGDPEREHRFRFAIGGAIARNVGTVRERSTEGATFTLGGFDYTHGTVDLHLKGWGFSLLAQGFYRKADRDFRTDGVLTEWSRSGLGYFVQAGAYVLDWLEIVGRFGDLRPMRGTDPRFVRIREMGGGINFMVLKHDLKLQLDYFVLDDGSFRDVRHQLRAQAQVYF